MYEISFLDERTGVEYGMRVKEDCPAKRSGFYGEGNGDPFRVPEEYDDFLDGAHLPIHLVAAPHDIRSLKELNGLLLGQTFPHMMILFSYFYKESRFAEITTKLMERSQESNEPTKADIFLAKLIEKTMRSLETPGKDPRDMESFGGFLHVFFESVKNTVSEVSGGTQFVVKVEVIEEEITDPRLRVFEEFLSNKN